MPPQIALLVEISRDAGHDPVLSLARALPYDGPEPRWDELCLPLVRPIFDEITPFSRLVIASTMCRRHLLICARPHPKIMQRRIRRYPLDFQSRSPDSAAAPLLNPIEVCGKDFQGIRNTLSCASAAKSSTTTTFLQCFTRGWMSSPYYASIIRAGYTLNRPSNANVGSAHQRRYCRTRSWS